MTADPKPASESFARILEASRAAGLANYRPDTCACGEELTWEISQFAGTKCFACRDRDMRSATLRDTLAQVPSTFRSIRIDDADMGTRTRCVGRLRTAWRALLAAPWVTLLGAAGTGKTSAMAAMFAAIAEASSPHGLVWTDAYRLGSARDRHALGSEAPLVRACARATVLALDELGSEPVLAKSAVPEILYQRHAAGDRTWVTTPFGERELAARYGDGIARRLFERAIVVELDDR